MADLQNLLLRLQKIQKKGEGKYLACCPSHDDKSPSLAIKLADDDKILLHCFAGCSVQEIVSSIGLELSDLMPDRPQYQQRGRPPKFNKFELFDTLAYESGILLVATSQLSTGVSLSQDDKARILQAESTVDSILREVRS